MRRLLIALLPLASLCACREKPRAEQDAAVPAERTDSSEPSIPEEPEATSDDHGIPKRPSPLLVKPRPPESDTASPPQPSVSTKENEEPEQAVSSALPGPERAKAAAKRVRPSLEKALAAKGLHYGDPVFIRAFKEEGQLELWVRKRETGKYEHFHTWDVAAQSGKPGPKLAEGDAQVPEGFYFVPASAMKPDSTFHLAFNVGYPNAYDRAHGRTGTFIMIHGNCVSIGCLAMTDSKIEEIYTLCDAALKNGQPYFRVNLFPFRMTAERLAREKDNEWFDFWTNLKEGSDFFEHSHIPPQAEVENGRYVFR